MLRNVVVQCCTEVYEHHSHEIVLFVLMGEGQVKHDGGIIRRVVGIIHIVQGV